LSATETVAEYVDLEPRPRDDDDNDNDETDAGEGAGGQEHVADPPQGQGGSPPDGKVRADDDGRTDEGDEEPRPARDAVSQRERQLQAELDAQLELTRALRSEMDRDPEFEKRVLRAVGQGGPDEGLDVAEHFERTLRDPNSGLTSDAAEVMLRAMKPFFQRYGAMERATRAHGTQVESLTRAVGSTRFVERLDQEGVPADVQRSADFQRHLAGLRGEREFQAVESRSPEFAASHAAARWLAQRSRRAGWKDDRQRVESARRARGADAPARGASQAARVVRIERLPHGAHVEHAGRVRLEAVSKGQPAPTIEFVDPK
jgi:hypothetical protein